MSHAAQSLERSNNLITSLQFPRALIPIASAISDLLQFLPATVVLFGVAIANGEPLRPHLLLFVPAVALAFMFASGLAFIASRAVHQISDLGQLLPFFNRALFYTSGVFFNLDRYGEGWVGAVMKHQPFAIYLQLTRSSLVEEIGVHWQTWAWGIFWAVLTCGLGFVYFWRAEARYGRG